MVGGGGGLHKSLKSIRHNSPKHPTNTVGRYQRWPSGPSKRGSITAIKAVRTKGTRFEHLHAMVVRRRLEWFEHI